MYLFICVILALVSTLCETARILVVVPTPSISHQVVFRPLTQELAKRGHQVVIITTDPAFPKGQTPENLTEIDTHDISYKIWREHMFSNSTEKVTKGKSVDVIAQMSLILPLLSKIFEIQMLTSEVQQLLNDKSEHFDLLLIEACVRSAVSVSHVFKAPVILMSSLGGIGENYDVMGAPSRPVLLYPTFYRQRIFNLSFWEKLTELYNHYLFTGIFSITEDTSNKIAKRLFGPDTPSISELENNVHMLFLNVHPMWDSNRPVPPGVIYMGGIHQKPSKELPRELKSYLDSSKHGVIYISFGTNVSPSSLPPEKIQTLVNVFSKLPYDVLWKWDKDELPGRSPNIRISKWLPQSDLLKHPNVKIFITQGGLQSTDEAITAGVPLIGMPMLADQWYNVEQYVYHNIGIRLDMETLTEEKFLNGISTIVNDDRYRASVARLRGVMRDQPQAPLARAVWWAEHVLRHGGAGHLRARAANMGWPRYLDAELAAAAAAAAAALAAALYLLLRILATTLSTHAKIKKS